MKIKTAITISIEDIVSENFTDEQVERMESAIQTLRDIVSEVDQVKQQEVVEGGEGTVTLAYYNTDDYGRVDSDFPSAIVTVKDSGDPETNDRLARKLGVEAGYRDMNTGFLQPRPLDGLRELHEKYTKAIDEIEFILGQAQNQSVNDVWTKRD